MRELSLFSGAGGGLLGTKLLGWEAVGYVERDHYCQAVLQARIRDGLLDPAPIFGDIRAFLESGDCDRFAGRVDVVTAGFPCQPFSVAGKRLGHEDERNLWPETADVLRRVRPRFALLENVPGLVSSGYFGTVLGDLAALGFDAEWTVLGADDAGAPHRRKRLWILAYADGERLRDERPGLSAFRQPHSRDQPATGPVPDPERAELRDEPGRSGGQDGADSPEPRDDGAQGAVADADREQRGSSRGGSDTGTDWRDDARWRGQGQRGAVADAEIRESRQQEAGNRRPSACGGGHWWSRDPADEGPESVAGMGLLADGLARGLDRDQAHVRAFVPRVAQGVQDRVQQLRALGNGQVPATVVRAWQELSERMERQA